MSQDTQLRSIVKSFSWRAVATIATITLVYAFTRELTISLAVGGIEVITKLILYYFHERIWDKFNLGRTSNGRKD